MEILLTNADEDPIEIDVDSWDLTEYRDAHRAAVFKIKCSRMIPISRYAHVVASEGKEVLFRGYIQKPKIKNKQTRELTCKGEEDLLLHRYTGRHSYLLNSRKLIHAFQSDPPSQSADVYGVTGNVGLLFQANSKIPYNGKVITSGTPQYDWFYHGHDWIYYLKGLGLDSRIGNANIYADGLLLPRVADFATLEATAISSWSDVNDLWVRLDDADYSFGFGPKQLMLAENCYDTNIRLGTIDLPTAVIAGNIQLNTDRILDIIIDLAEFFGLEPRFRRTAEYTYLDLLKDPVDSEFYLPEEHIEDVSQATTSDLRPHALIGLGIGSRDVQQIYTPSDHTWMGIWIEEKFEVEDGCVDTMGILKSTVNAEYARLLDDEIFTVTPTPSWGHTPRPNDIINLQLLDEPSRSLQVTSLKRTSKSSQELELGGRKPDIIDAFNAKSSLSRVYSGESMKKVGSPIMINGEVTLGDATHGWCTSDDFKFTVPADIEKEDGSHRVLADISVDTDLDPESMQMSVVVNSNANIFCQPLHHNLGDSITELDITDLVSYGSESTMKVYIKRKGEWDGASCSEHPTATVSITITSHVRLVAAE